MGRKYITFDKLKRNIKNNIFDVHYLILKYPGELLILHLVQLLGKQGTKYERISASNDKIIIMMREIIERCDIRKVYDLVLFCKKYNIEGVPSWMHSGFVVDLTEEGWCIFEK